MVQRSFISLDGRRLACLDRAATSSYADPLVFLHAFPLDADMWQPQFDGDAGLGDWRLVAPDLAGFGRSDDAIRNPDATLDADARDVLSLLDRLEVRTATFCGLSMGGYVAFAILRHAPERVSALVLADTRAEADTEEARQGRLEMIDLAAREGAGPVAAQMLPRLLGPTTRARRPDVVERVNGMIESNTAGGVEAGIRRMMNRPDSSDLVPGIGCPTLVIVGAEDAVTPPAVARELHRRIPGADLVELPEAGHLSNLEQPSLFNEALTRFLTKVKSCRQ